MAKIPHFFRNLFAAGAISGVRFLGAGLTFALTALISVLLGPEGAGRFFISITWATGIAMVAHWGAPNLILLALAPIAQSWRRPIAAAFLARLLFRSIARLSVIFLAAALVFFLFNESIALRSFGIEPAFVCVLAPLLIAQRQYAAAAKALHKPILACGLEFCLIAAFTLLAYLAVRDIEATSLFSQFTIFYVIGAGLSAGLLAWVSIRELGVTRPVRNKAVQPIMRRSTSFALIELSIYLSTWGSLMLMPLFLTTADVGIFNVAMRIASMVSLVTVSIPAVLIPRLSVAYAAHDEAEFKRLTNSMWVMMAVAGASMFAGVVILGPLVLSLMGEAFLPAYQPMLIASAGLCGALALGPAGAALSVRGQEKIMRNVTIAGGLTTLVLSMPAMHLYGIHGAAAVSAVGAICSKAVLLYFQRRTSLNTLSPEEK